MMRHFRFTLLFFAMALMGTAWSQDRIDYQIPYFPGGPTIDGVVSPDEMAAQNTFFMGWDELEEFGGSLVVAQSGFEHENVSADMYFSYDNDHLYISAVAMDNTPFYGPSGNVPFNAYDIIQPLFNPFNDPDHSFPPDPGGGPAAIYDVAAATNDDTGPNIYRHGAVLNDDQHDRILDGLIAGSVQMDGDEQTGYTIELALPWDIAMDDVDPGYVPQGGDQHGFGFLMIGEEFGNDPVLLWDAGDNVDAGPKIGDPTNWNTATLGPKRINYQIPYLKGGPTLDGEVTDAEKAAQNTFFMGWDELEEVGGSLVVAQSGIEHENVSADMYFSYDEDNLYISAVAMDNTPFYGPSGNVPFNAYDIIQPYFNPFNDPDHAFPPDPGGGPAAIYDVAAATNDDTGPNIYRHGATLDDDQHDEILDGGIAGSVQMDGDEQTGYTVELALPWDVLMDDVDPDYVPQPGDEHGFGFLMIGEEFGNDPTLLWDAGDNVDAGPKIGDPTNWNWATLLAPIDMECDVNGDGTCDAADIDAMSQMVIDGTKTPEERVALIESEMPDGFHTYIGDSDLNGQFDEQDIVAAFIAGKYLGPEAGWAEGDWDGNLRFDEQDFVSAFVAGGYLLGPRTAAVPEPSSLVLLVLGGLAVIRRRR